MLLALVVYAGMTFLYQPAAVSFPGHTQPDAAISSAFSDFDGDGFPDPATVSTRDFRPAIELLLSRTHAHVVLPFSTASAAYFGSLSMQDIDHDGDTDLLWKSAPPSSHVIVWLNNGAGRFECLCPTHLQDQRAILGGAGVNAAHSHTSDRIGSPERLPLPGQVLAVSWEILAPTLSRRPRPAPVWGLSTPPHSFTSRGPPLVRC
jgi:hypothetical protein